MRSEQLKKLLSNVVRSQPLVSEFIQLQGNARRANSGNFSTSDHQAMQFTFDLLSQLSDQSIKLKLDNNPRNNTSGETKVPSLLSSSDITKIARNKVWTKYEAGFFACGFIISEQIKKDCEKLLYPLGGEPSFTIGYFPILNAVLEIEKLLLKSDLFPQSQRNFLHDTDDGLLIMDWFKRLELPLPKGLADKAREFHSNQDIRETTDTPQVKNLNPKERTSMLKLIYAMAKGKFNYAEGQSLGPAKNKIHLAILDAGLDMSERTIGDYLKAAQAEADIQREKNQ